MTGPAASIGEMNAVVQRQVVRVERVADPGGASEAGASMLPASISDSIAVEEPLEIRVNGEVLAITMRTPGGPGDDERLALGFLFAEGLVKSRDDITRIIHCGKPGTPEARNVLDVIPAGGVIIDFEKSAPSRRGTLTTSACGICGRTSIDDVLARIPPREDSRASSISAAQIFAAVDALARRQPVFARTGGLHCAAISDASGLFASAEDVGRHNAVDKAIGLLLASGAVPEISTAPKHPRVLAVSGRTSFEIVQKAAMARIAAVASVSAPSSLAIDLAAQSGILLAGFVRGGKMNVYTGIDRLQL